MSKTIDVPISQGATCTAKLFVYGTGTDTVAETIATLTEYDNRKGWAYGVVTVTGKHHLIVFDGSTVDGYYVGEVSAVDGSVSTFGEDTPTGVDVLSIAGATQQVPGTADGLWILGENIGGVQFLNTVQFQSAVDIQGSLGISETTIGILIIELLTAANALNSIKGVNVAKIEDVDATDQLDAHSGGDGALAAEIVTAIFTALLASTDFSTALSIGKLLKDNINATVASRATQTSVDDLPTNAELATALGTADDAVLAAIAALNNLSQANVRTALGLAAANLDTQIGDLPTNAELATALAAADDAVLAAIVALNNLSIGTILAGIITDHGAGSYIRNTEPETGLATATELAKVPKSDGAVGWNATARAQINAEADTALSDIGATSVRLAKLDEVTASRMGALTDLIDGGRLDLIIDIIAADTTTDIPGLIAALPTAASVFTAVLTTAMTEAYAADGAAPTLAQAIYLIQQSLHEFAIVGTSRTVKKLDGTTTAAVFTLDSATVPTSTTRAS